MNTRLQEQIYKNIQSFYPILKGKNMNLLMSSRVYLAVSSTSLCLYKNKQDILMWSWSCYIRRFVTFSLIRDIFSCLFLKIYLIYYGGIYGYFLICLVSWGFRQCGKTLVCILEHTFPSVLWNKFLEKNCWTKRYRYLEFWGILLRLPSINRTMHTV